MAIGDDFSINVAGDIRHVSGSDHYTVLQLHRWLQQLADDQAASGNDVVDITSLTPSERIYDTIITLLNGYNIDDDAAEYFYGGSITQDDGDTVYSGLRVLGAVNDTDTQLLVVQDHAFYDGETPFWGDQSTGGYNGNAAQQVLMRVLVKTREYGRDIDGKRIRVQARHWGDSFDFFPVTLGVGESVASISTTPDGQNNTAQGTVTTYTHVTNSGTIPVNGQDETYYDNSPTTEGTFAGGSGWADPGDIGETITLSDGTVVTIDAISTGAVSEFTVNSTYSRGATSSDTLTQVSTTGSGTGFSLSPDVDNIEIDPDNPRGGYQQIDLNEGSGNKPYYSKWTFGADTSGDGLKGMWEYGKDLTRHGTVKTVDAVLGSLFLGITHSFNYDNEGSGPFIEHEIISWGTDVTYDTLAGGTFAVGDYVVFKRASVIINAGKVLYDNGSTQMKVALESTTALADGDQIVEAVLGTVTALIDTTITNNDKAGGEGYLLALYDAGATGTLYMQLIHGSAPVDGLPVRGRASGATCDVDTTITARTVPKVFLGSYTGSLIGAYGIGVDPDDLTATDSVQSLDGNTYNPPNNVTFTLSGLVSGEDYVLVGPKDTGDAFEWDQLALQNTYNGPGVTTIQCTTSIPTDTPASAGTTSAIRIELDDGRYRRVAWTSYSGDTFTIPSTDFTDPDDATAGNNVMIAYIDKLATGTSEQFTCIFSSPRTLWIRVRDGGGTPIKTYEGQATLGAAGGSAVASRIPDA